MSIQDAHDSEAAAAKRKFENLGYTVVLEPSSQTLPIDLGGYRPDLVAYKAGQPGGLVVEIKSNAAKASIERLAEVADRVREQEGWRFVLITSDDIVVPYEGDYLPTWPELRKRLGEVERLLSSGSVDPAILYAYAVFEGAMRLVASEQAIPVERLQSTRVRNSLYSLGLLDADQYAVCKQFMRLRNKVAHGFQAERDVDLTTSFVSMTRGLIDEWESMACSAEKGSST